MTPPSPQLSPATSPLPGANPSTPTTYVPALDGLRALAVAGVVLFHAFPGLAPGGFAGVDVFFVLSGFLITGGLLQRRAGGGALRGFWAARARRLLPALLLLLLVIGPLVLLAGGDAGVGFGGQVVAATLFVTNWHLVAEGNSYFAQASPPVLQHLWSLAVEEQFYLLWPLVLWALLGLVRPPRARLAVVAGAAAASLALMVSYAATGHVGRAYYGSDSHSFGLLAGAALALVHAARPVRTTTPLRGAAVVVLGLLGLTVAFGGLDGGATSTYVVGLPAVVGLTLLLVHVCLADAGPATRLLGSRLPRAIGRRSYGLYLWHWPVLVLAHNAFPTATLRHAVLTGTVAIALTALAAAASYAWIEVPLRRQGPRGTYAVLARWAREPRPYRRRTAAAAGALVGLAAVSTLVAATSGPRAGIEQDRIEAGIAAIRHANYETRQTPPPHRTGHTRRRAQGPGSDITAVGDSVMLAAAPELLEHYPRMSIDAVVSRQASAAPAILRRLAERGTLRPVVVVGLGTNGAIATSTLDAVRAAIGPRRQLVLVDVFVPRPWERPVNDELAWYAAHRPRTLVVHWHDAIAAQPWLLAPDHIHPGPAGGALYARTLADALARLAPTPTPTPDPTARGASARP